MVVWFRFNLYEVKKYHYLIFNQTGFTRFAGAWVNKIWCPGEVEYMISESFLSVRGKESNQHHGAGYLIHPETIKVVKAWLNR